MKQLAALAATLVLIGCASDAVPPTEGLVGKPAEISHIHGLGVDGSGMLYAATHFGLLRRAEDRWVYASNDRTDHMGFSLHPNGVMYRSGHSQERPSIGVETSTDGADWTHLSDVADPPVDFHAMAVSFADAGSLWGWDSGGRGMFRSSDGGKSWKSMRPRGIEGQVYVLAGSAAPDVVYAGTAKGLFRSTDGGSTWRRLAGIGGGWVSAIGTDPFDRDRLIAFSQRGMRSSADAGETWVAAAEGPEAGAQITSLAVGKGSAYAADASTVFESLDAGRTWRRVA